VPWPHDGKQSHDRLRCRASRSYEASADGVGKDQVIDEIVRRVAVAG
jgi:hypothetical protein